MLSRGTTNEGGSFISRDQYEIIKSRPQIAATIVGAQEVLGGMGLIGADAPPAPPT